MELRNFHHTFLENKLCKNIKAALNNFRDKGERVIINLHDDIQRLVPIESAAPTTPSFDRNDLNLEDQSFSQRKRDIKASSKASQNTSLFIKTNAMNKPHDSVKKFQAKAISTKKLSENETP